MTGHAATHNATRPAGRSWLDATDDETRRLEKAIMLSGGNLAICEALLRGENVPIEDLDPYWVAKYRIRAAA